MCIALYVKVSNGQKQKVKVGKICNKKIPRRGGHGKVM